MWRAACTLHLTAIFPIFSRTGYLWEDKFAPLFYHGIEVGRIEVLGSKY